MRALVTGAHGMLGSDLCRLLQQGHEVIGLGRNALDVCDRAAVRRTLMDLRPDSVFHLAAMTDVDACERAPADAWRVNAEGTAHIAQVCHAIGALLVFPSSIAVFDGEKAEPYTEDDLPRAANLYGRTKLAGEDAARINERHVVARSGWLFGGGQADKKFVGKILRLARGRSELSVVVDKFGSPTYTHDFAAGMIALVERGFYGTVHVVNAGGPASRYQVARAVLDCAGITSCALQPITSDAFPLPAPRPRMEAAASVRWPLAPLRDWREALCDYIRTQAFAEGVKRET
jgi:dTDP-4-dehydrorhamnose reductase